MFVAPAQCAQLELMFTVLFTAEIAITVAALGPVSFLKSGWRQSDLLWLAMAWWSTLGPRVTGLRLFRVVLPLRAVSRVPGMKRLAVTLVAALPHLSGVIMLASMYFVMFAIVGVQLWSGRWRQRCDVDAGQYCDIDKCWSQEDLELNNDNLLSQRDGCLCGAADTCSPQDMNPFETVDTRPNRRTNSTDIMSFDSVPWAVPIVFHIVR